MEGRSGDGHVSQHSCFNDEVPRFSRPARRGSAAQTGDGCSRSLGLRERVPARHEACPTLADALPVRNHAVALTPQDALMGSPEASEDKP